MIKKFKTITNLAVFKDFNWDNSVRDKDGNVVDFKTINILYGRNYSGKTTLSRIIRAMETGAISDKYCNPKFEIEFEDGSIINQDNYTTSNHDIRVFNEDFIRDNLSFLKDTNDNGNIKPFAILGEHNAKLQSDVNDLRTLLGSDEEGNETGLYKDFIERQKEYEKANSDYKEAEHKLNSQLTAKATGDKDLSIKYNSNLYGDQNYNVSKLKTDIEAVSNGYTPPSDQEKDAFHSLIKENVKSIIPPINEIIIDFKELSGKTKELVERKVGDSQKIEELVRDAELNRWVKEGRKFHRDRDLNKCSFCGQDITLNRWSLLDKHFDEESEKLDNDINMMLNHLSSIEARLNDGIRINENAFYSKFQLEIDSLQKEFEQTLKVKALDVIESIKSQLNKRKDQLFTPQIFIEIDDFSIEISNLYTKYHKIEKDSNNYSSQLYEEQKNAKKQLRLFEVFRFIHEIKYHDECNNIQSLKRILESKEKEKKRIEAEIIDKKKSIEEKLSLMNDEEKGAKRVDKYLQDYFGYHCLSLSAKEDVDATGKHFKFEVLRNGKNAYNLSEGECSLIAFCYFMAKLEDIHTYDKKPIIWIDDPISSLDSNHVFFVYSLINGKIVAGSRFQQLFISTHNLDFLKYLKRLPIVAKDRECKKSQFFVVNRIDKESIIQLMPSYLRAHITEFNFLFKQIYDCATITNIDDSNYTVFYNFGNNARKFLELYLYYKYPDNTKDEDKRKKFFGDEIESIITGRLINEYSHLCGVMERGEHLVEVPEMKIISQLIVNTIKQKDIEQYRALLNSIGVSETD